MKKCQFCAEEIQDEAIVCKHCGREQNREIVNKGKGGRLAFFLFTGAILFIGSCIAFYISNIQKPNMPIRVTYRQAILGDSMVASFKNHSKRQLSISVKLTNPTMGQTKIFRLDLSSGETKEIGHLEGWGFASGDIIEISHNDYRTMEVKIP